MRFSSSFKVGILTLVALFILLFTILWVKGRSLSAGERIEVTFHDVNGMRPGSGVQMMGLRIGQVEEIIPVINGDNSYVKLKFVITEPGIKIPKASVFSIQQSGLIGEQFLEITPPKIRTTYLPVNKDANLLYKDDLVQMKFDKGVFDVGKVKDVQIMSSMLIPALMREHIKTKYAYKVTYYIDLPGVAVPDYMIGKMVNSKGEKKLNISMLDNSVLPYPHQSSLYTVIDPMRISDFLDLQYRAAESLTETTLKVNEILSDDVIGDLQASISNIKLLTAKATTTVGKAEKLIDSSKKDLDDLMIMANDVANSFIRVSDSVNSILGDDKFKKSIISTTESVGKLSNNLNKILDKTDADKMATDLQAIAQNLNEITTYVSTMTKDNKLKKQLMDTVNNTNKAMLDISNALEAVNSMTPAQKYQIQQIVEDTAVTTHNLKKFSEKLNKRFLLFRLIF